MITINYNLSYFGFNFDRKSTYSFKELKRKKFREKLKKNFHKMKNHWFNATYLNLETLNWPLPIFGVRPMSNAISSFDCLLFF